MLDAFHFLHPAWLLALLPLALLAWPWLRSTADNAWQRVVDAPLLPLLMVGGPQHHSATRRGAWVALVAGVIAVLALADPTWQRRPQPVFQTQAARVVVLDLSRAMNATDLKPSRVVRARYAVDDLLKQAAEGLTGLVVYADDAYTVTPLTRDAGTIRSQLAVLSPGLMPSAGRVEGERADRGLAKAGELLRQAGVVRGQVLLLADGVADGRLEATTHEAAALRAAGYRVSVLGVGTPAGAPLTDAEGRLLQGDEQGLVMARLDSAALRQVASAGGGEWLKLDAGGASLAHWLRSDRATVVQGDSAGAESQAWVERGPWLLLLLLPLGMLAFRRNALLALTAVVLLPWLALQPQPAMAATWGDLWQRPEQQAAQLLARGDYDRAAQLTTDAGRHGAAEYQRGDYQQALADFGRATDPAASYNRGNALARLGRYADAVAAYEQALKIDPADADARANKAAVEALLKQQRQQPQQKQQPQKQQHADTAQQDKQSGKQQGKEQGKEQGQQSASRNDGKSASGSSPAESGAGKPDARSSGSSKNEAEGSQPEGTQHSAEAASAALANGDHAFARAAQQLAAAASAPPSPPQASQAARAAAPNPNGSAAQPATAQTAPAKPAGGSGQAQPLQSEEQLAAEQWLRRIPDDPGGLLRRKFLYQYRQRQQRSARDEEGAGS